jgi:hypothetical protein
VTDIVKLKAAGIVTVLGVAQTPRKNLLKIKVNSDLLFGYKCCRQFQGDGSADDLLGNVRGISSHLDLWLC